MTTCLRSLFGLLVLLAALSTLGGCALERPPHAVQGVLDLRGWDWDRGPAPLGGEWEFNQGWRNVPDTWTGSVAGGRDGLGSGTYRLLLVLPAGSPPLALRYGTASTAFSVRVAGTELVSVGHPDADPHQAQPAYAPGTIRLPAGSVLDLEVFVSNHEYRVGGLWSTPVVGPVATVEREQWMAEASSVALGAALAAIGVSSLLLFAYRRSNRSFLHLGIFALLVALRYLVTGEYPLVRMVPGLPFSVLIRLEYWTAFLPLPSAALFFADFFPGLVRGWALRLMTWPSWAFAALALVLPLDWLTRSIVGFYPVAVPALVIGTFLLVRRILRDRQGLLLLTGAAILAITGLADMVTAALFTTTGNLVPWGLGLFVALQATTLSQRFLAAFEATEALLAQKVLLVKEVHHRVKNSLQVVASLVSLQSNRTNDPEQKAVFQALRQRIHAIALVHEKLYGQAAGGRPDVGEYLADLLKLQYPADRLGAAGVTWTVHTEPLAADVDYCIDAGIILTELVANAHKHGLQPRGGGQLEVNIAIRSGRLGLEVIDDGPGFPSEFRPEASTGLGFRLVLALLQRNDGTLKLLPGPGGRVQVELNLPLAAD